MAFAKGKETSETELKERKYYTGVGVFNVLALNPSKAELEKIYGITLDKDPEYITVQDNIKNIRLDFIVKHVANELNPVDFISKLSFFLKSVPMYNKDKTKIQVVNKYGEFTWVSVEDAKIKKIPDNMPWFEGPYYPCHQGEEKLTAFMKAFLNIPNKSFTKPDGTVIFIENKSDAEARLEKVAEYFNGNLAELKNLIIARKTNKVKLACGVKTTDDNKTYQTFYDRMFLKYGQSNYLRIYENIRNDQRNGAFPNVEFGTDRVFKEYSITPNSTQTFASEPNTVTPKGLNWLSTEPEVEETEGSDDLPF